MDPFEIDDLHERLLSISKALPSWVLTEELEARLKTQAHFPQQVSQLCEEEPELFSVHVAPEMEFLYQSFQAVAKALPLWVLQEENESRVQHQAGKQQPVTQIGEPDLFSERSPSLKRPRDELQVDSLTNLK